MKIYHMNTATWLNTLSVLLKLNDYTKDSSTFKNMHDLKQALAN